ncbi:hypothetical protein B296_00021913 [Ensete ventricosum]|uniref:Purple acid phosphatase Fn3-like domain-containing protein n=1 Tax=Ensete ventricosum TaxID=4639 RepID=A0A427AV86_ENSVE|nr:hypothetical protein B296_00021913 [Ensete ventricosum]
MAGVALETTALSLALLAIATVMPALLPCSAELQRFERPAKADGSLSLLVVGDWGRKGQFNQSQVKLVRPHDCFDPAILLMVASVWLEIVDFFFVDTTPFVESYWTNPENDHYDWRDVAPRETYISDLLKVYLRAFSIFFFIGSKIQYLTSGGGSMAWRGVFTPTSDKLRFFYDGQGFMSLQLTRTAADIAFYDVFGRVLHEWGVSKHLHPAA